MTKAKRTAKIIEQLQAEIGSVDHIAAFLCGAAATIKQHDTWDTDEEMIYTVYLIEAAEGHLANLRTALDELST